jgi:hypothetical protein
VRSYLANRTTYFVFNSQKSSNFKITAEVPQKSPLLSVLFLLYIAILYAAPSWHDIGDELKEFSKTLTPVKNKCLRIVSGAYKAIPTRYLESEMAVPPYHGYGMQYGVRDDVC